MIEQAQHILKDVFGYDSFRPLQKEVIQHILQQHDTLVIMPTGGGKSLCYQIPALLFKGLTIVVSPLISLMQDQVAQLTELGVGAVALNSSLTAEEYQQNRARILHQEAKLLYLAPETLLMQRTLSMLQSLRVDCLTIDEAHCISEWGHDFRPEYRLIAEIRAHFPSAVCVALTATATPRVRQDIKTSLHFDDSDAFITSFDRTNLLLEIRQKDKPVLQTIEFLEKFPDQSGIIYCLSRRQVNELADVLTRKKFSVRPYHAGLSVEERQLNQELFLRDDVQVMVATVAFGMGINKLNIRFVLHYNLPRNIESYYQQIGRAGRDGLPSHCRLLFGYNDLRTIRFFLNEKDEQGRRIAQMHLEEMLGFAESDLCRRIPLLRYFGETRSEEPCNMCDNCLAEKKDCVNITIPAQKFLSCVKRSGELFGAAHIIAILRGSGAQKVLKFGHERLSTYGIGLEFSKQQWLHLSRQFLQKGLMIQDPEHGSLKLTPKAWSVFRGEEQVWGKIEQQQLTRFQGRAYSLDYDRRLYALLRKQVKEMADAANLPPYAIFPDSTLIEMSHYFPHSRESLLSLSGVGAKKLERYGKIFLDLIKRYCAEHGIEEILKSPLHDTPTPVKKPECGSV
ncbi:DNA helicase RecQ [candidate division KSB3 bacterium]|uniref:DNA helicase RecQ n=1 Tax=candidate division KSB3 bacterium TaxID=2044937 RepID=A0A2G6E1G8_9BACT|nr:MAG: DNA helicase RecQ [candidate division KSB3 bacterium]PIE28518.1 MAG: DNA helicase RecQ [candidate division KSB3 bacterium]